MRRPPDDHPRRDAPSRVGTPNVHRTQTRDNRPGFHARRDVPDCARTPLQRRTPRSRPISCRHHAALLPDPSPLGHDRAKPHRRLTPVISAGHY